MPYCTPTDVRNLHQLFTATDFSDDYISTFITKAEARLDNRLSPHYQVPFNQVPAIITSICADMAGALLCEHHFSGINYRENTPLGEVYRKRAESDLTFAIDNATIDELPGVVRKQPDLPEMRLKVASTTPNKSPMQRRLERFENATQAPLANLRNWI